MSNTDRKYYGFIYITTNLINDKQYIGKKKYSGCWQSYLGSGLELQAAIKKYGKHNFSRIIIDEVMTADELNEKEKYWIKKNNAIDSEQFYNIAAGGDGGEVRVGYSAEKYQASEKHRVAKVAAICRTRVGEKSPTSKLTEASAANIVERLLANEYLSDVARDFNVAYETIWDIRKHKTWKHLTNGVEFPCIKDRKRSFAGKSVVQLSLQGKSIACFASAREAGRATNTDYKKISLCCQNKRKTSNDFMWQFTKKLS